MTVEQLNDAVHSSAALKALARVYDFIDGWSHFWTIKNVDVHNASTKPDDLHKTYSFVIAAARIISHGFDGTNLEGKMFKRAGKISPDEFLDYPMEEWCKAFGVLRFVLLLKSAPSSEWNLASQEPVPVKFMLWKNIPVSYHVDEGPIIMMKLSRATADLKEQQAPA